MKNCLVSAILLLTSLLCGCASLDGSFGFDSDAITGGGAGVFQGR